MPWNPTLGDSQILAVHAAFLNHDRILFFGGNQHDPDLSKTHQTNATRVYDCITGAVTEVESPPFDLFCCGHSLSIAGTLMAAGGTKAFRDVVPGEHHEHFPGLRDSAVFRFDHNGYAWRSTADMNRGPRGDSARGDDTGGRWYPTLITLPNGDVLALSGHPGEDDRDHTNYIPEVFTPAPAPSGSWHRLGSHRNPAQDALFAAHTTTYYPRGHLLPTGDVLLSSPAGGRTATMRVRQGPWSAAFADVCRFTPGESGRYLGWDETSVLLPLRAEDGYRSRRVLLTGGETSWILDLTDWNPGVTPPDVLRWEPTAPRALAGAPRRINGHAVLLPTGEVLCVGGVAGVPVPGRPDAVPDSTGVRTPEIYNPFSDTWSALTDPGERAEVVRNYHSVALLMPDGRVWTAGSNINADAGVDRAELRIEIYEPWYHGHPDRPEITSAPDRWKTGEQFPLHTTQAARIASVAMVRTGSCTHAFNADQRYLTLDFRYAGDDLLTVTAPPDGNLAPSGMYFLYTINSDGLPSAGTTVVHNGAPRSEREREWNALFG